MYRIIVCAILVISTISACSKKITTYNQQPNEPIYIERNGNNSKTAPPQRVTPNNKAEKTAAPIEIYPAAPLPKEVAKQPNPKITFTPIETEHVRLANYNPFITSDNLEIDLQDVAPDFCYPYNGKPISRYGMRGRSMHTGIDIKAIPNDTIRAAMPGVVRMSKVYSGYGNIIVVRHYNGLESVYGHNSKNLVHPNDVVEAGTPIALAGRTGRATTEHLHFELRVMGEPFNPELMIDPENRVIRDGKIYLSRRNGKVSASGSKYSPMVSESSTSSSSTTPAVSASSKTYTVKKGDTLYKIAKSNGTTVKKICQLNNISETKTLRIGEKLKVK